jgi:hypothetical protein
MAITARADTLRDIEHTFGQLPGWVWQLPDSTLGGFWSLFQDFKTTRRWQGAMARAALSLVHNSPHGDQLRIPMAMALLELYGEVADDELVAMMEVLVPMETITTVAVRG